MRLIDKDELAKVKFHPLPYTHIVPTDAEVESYERGWNDAIDAIIDNAPTIEEFKTGRWINENIVLTSCPPQYQWHCSECGETVHGFTVDVLTNYCPYCGAKMCMDWNEMEETLSKFNKLLGMEDSE